MKIVLSTKDGKSYQQELSEDQNSALIGKKIGDTIDGSVLGLEGYELLLTGGSDDAGFPMRRDVQGSARKRIFAVEGVGLKKKGKGIKQRKTVAGNTVHTKTAQLNFKVLKEGKKKLGAEAAPAEGEAPAEEKKEEKAPVEEKKEAPAKEKPAEKAPPAEEKKEKAPAEKKAEPEAPKEKAPAEEKSE